MVSARRKEHTRHDTCTDNDNDTCTQHAYSRSTGGATYHDTSTESAHPRPNTCATCGVSRTGTPGDQPSRARVHRYPAARHSTPAVRVPDDFAYLDVSFVRDRRTGMRAGQSLFAG